MRNTRMAFLAHILRLIRMAAACAVILALGFALPSAAHPIAGHHGSAAVSPSGESHAGAAMPAASHHVSWTGAHTGHDAPQNADTGNCCSGACMAVAVLSLHTEEISLTQPVRWKQVNSQLPSQEQIALLRPPRA